MPRTKKNTNVHDEKSIEKTTPDDNYEMKPDEKFLSISEEHQGAEISDESIPQSSFMEKSIEAMKEQLKAKKEAKTLLPLEDYVKSGIHLGTKVIMPHMRKYVYRRRADGLAVLNTALIDIKLKEATEFLTQFNLKDIIIVCKREAGWRAVKLFSEVTGIRVFTKKYPAGIITNIQLSSFFEPELVVICDPWLDKNALHDAKKINKKVLALCDTNNITREADVIVPCNNKSEKSLGLIFYILAQALINFHNLEKKIKLEDFTGDLTLEKREKEREPLIVNPEAQAF